MRSRVCAIAARTAAAAATCIVSVALTVGAAQAQTTPYVMKITTPTIHAALDQYGRNFAAAVEKDSGGRIKGQVFPASPARLHSAPDRRHPVRRNPGRDHSTGIFRRRRSALRGVGRSRPRQLDEAGSACHGESQVLKLMLGLGANKGLHGIGLFMAEPAEVVSRTPISHLADFKGKRLRIFASEFQSVAFQRLGVTAIAMSPADVLPAVQQGTLDGAVFGVQLLSGLHFYDTAKYVTLTHHSGIFAVVEVSKKWYELATSRPAESHRSRRRRAGGRNQSAIDSDPRRRNQGVDQGRRSDDYLAARGPGENAADHGQRRGRCRQDQAGVEGGL